MTNKHIHEIIASYGSPIDYEKIHNDISDAVSAKAVNAHYHPTKSYLVGYDYSESCSYDKLWDKYPVAKLCRGLVLNTELKQVVGLCMPKFFNLSEGNASVSEKELMECDSIRVEEKVDGSLGIIFYDSMSNEWIIKTRGSFTSDQAIKAQSWIPQGMRGGLNENWTYSAEIIYANNRVIVDYGDYTGLFFFGAYNNISGEWKEINNDTDLKCILQPSEMRYIVRLQYTHAQLMEHLSVLTGNEEGFVCIMPDGRRVKIKGERYCILHKAKFGLSPLSVWEAMVSGKEEEARKILPEEFHDTFDSIHNKLIAKYNDEVVRLDKIVLEHRESLPEKYGRKEFAIAAQKYSDKAYLMISLKCYDGLEGFKGKEFNHDSFTSDQWKIYSDIADKQQKEYILNLIRPKNNIINFPNT